MNPSSFVWRTYLWRKRFAAVCAEIDRCLTLPPDQARDVLSRRLLAQIRHFGQRADALPEWREAAQLTDPREVWKIWSELPILTKQDLERRFPVQEMRQRFNLSGVASATGGSTGEPTRYFHDWEMVRIGAMCNHYCRIRQGWRPGMATIAVWGSERDIGKSRAWRGRLSSLLRNEWLVDSYKLTEQTAEAVRSLVERHAPVALYGFTSMLEFVARRLQEQGVKFRDGEVAVAWNGGEMLFPEQSDIFAQVFGTPILNFYGGRELAAMAFQRAAGEPLTVLRPYQFLEVVDDAGRAVGPGESGRLIWTNTVCRGTPFLRYDVGDQGQFSAEGQDESGIHHIHAIQGRNAGLFHLPDGTVVNALIWNHLLKEFSEIEQFQVAIRHQGNRLELRLRGRGFAQARDAELRQLLDRFLQNVSYTIVWMDEIPRTSQGKLIQVVRED